MTDDATDQWNLASNGSESVGETEAFRRWRADTGRVLGDADHARIDVYLRSMLPPPGAKDAQVTVLDDLQALSETSPVETVTVNVWGERLCLCEKCTETDIGRRMLNTVRELERWGGEYDASTESFFERTCQESSLVGESHEGIAPPRVTAALYVDGSVQGVFPARFEDECYSVTDFASAVARATSVERSAEPVESSH